MSENKSTESTKLAEAKPARATFQELVNSDRFKAQITAALPTHITPERFIRVLMTATIKNPQLLECTQESLFKGIFDCAAAGLEIDGRRAHLIPFRNSRKNCMEATLIIDFKGLAELAMRSGTVSNIHADVVCENDQFEVDRGVITKHVVDYRKDRGKMYAAYCIIRMKDGGEKAEVMSKHEIDRIRASSRGRDATPWTEHFEEMSKKTVFRRASKWVPLSAEIKNVLEAEQDDEPIDLTPKSNFSALIGAPSAPDATVEAQASEETAPPA
jgi:recombination protein RecT